MRFFAKKSEKYEGFTGLYHFSDIRILTQAYLKIQKITLSDSFDCVFSYQHQVLWLYKSYAHNIVDKFMLSQHICARLRKDYKQKHNYSRPHENLLE